MTATGVGDDDGIQLRSFVDRETDLRDESGEAAGIHLIRTAAIIP